MPGETQCSSVGTWYSTGDVDRNSATKGGLNGTGQERNLGQRLASARDNASRLPGTSLGNRSRGQGGVAMHCLVVFGNAKAGMGPGLAASGRDVGTWPTARPPDANESTYVACRFPASARPVPLKRVVLGYPCSATSDFRFDVALSYKLAAVISAHSAGKPALVVSVMAIYSIERAQSQ
ncbi:hypothetical protein MRX96_028042 [Rhipicephalus microplus]